MVFRPLLRSYPLRAERRALPRSGGDRHRLSHPPLITPGQFQRQHLPSSRRSAPSHRIMKAKSFYSSSPKGGTGIMLWSLLMLAGLLVLPLASAHRQGLDLRWVAAHGLVLSIVTYSRYASDKRRAQEGEWRIPEAQLHLLELLGGWPGALLAQRRLRHKCSKGGYQFVFWLIILGYQLAALDSFQNWRCSRASLRWLEEWRVQPSNHSAANFEWAKPAQARSG